MRSRSVLALACFGALALNAAEVPEEADFLLTLRESPSSDPVVVSAADAQTTDVVEKGALRHVTFSFKSGPVRTVVASRSRVTRAERRFSLKVETAAGWHLELTDYPVLKFPAVIGTDVADDKILIGGSKGGLCVAPGREKTGWQTCGRSPHMVASFVSYFDGDHGYYVAAEDPVNAPKLLGLKRTAEGFELVSRRMAYETGTVNLPYEIVAQELERGDECLLWQDFADLYRPFLARCPWSRVPFAERKDIPTWLKDAPAIVRFSRQWLEHPEWIEDFTAWWRKTYGEGPVVAALWGWEKVGTWWGPDYFPCHPSDEIFRRDTSLMRARGFHPFAWPSGYNWCKTIGLKDDGSYDVDYRSTFIREARDMIVVNRDGRLYHRDAFWLRDGALTTLCGGVPKARDWFASVARGLGERGCDLVQVDQQVCGELLACYEKSHGHPMAEGAWQTEAFAQLLKTAHSELRAVEPNGAVAFEEPNPVHNDFIGIQDYRDLEASGAEYASVFNYFFHGYVPTFQSNPFRGDLYTLAWQAADGQMPFHRMITDDFASVHPALLNGGFEEGVDSVRGPVSWDRIMEGRFYLNVNVEEPVWDFAGANNMGWLGIGYRYQGEVCHGGSRALLVDPSLSTNRSYRMTTVQIAQTVEGLCPGRYRVSVWAKTERGGELATLRLGSRKGEISSVSFPEAGKGWREIAAEAEVGADGVLRVLLFVKPGARVFVDDVQLADASGSEVRRSGEDWYVSYLKKWIGLYRGAGRPFLADGFQIKPPALKCARVQRLSRRVPAVCHAAYRSLDGRKALVLANATHEPQEVSYRWNGNLVTRTLAPAALEIEF